MRSTAKGHRAEEPEVPLFIPPRLFIERRIKHRITVSGGLASFASLEDLTCCEGDARLLNVSLHGCQLDSEQDVPQKPFQLILLIPPHPRPILINSAVTQWSHGRIYGISFLDLRSASLLSLQEAVWQGSAPSWVVSSMRFTRSSV